MTREKAIERILSDLHLGTEYEDFVLQTIGRLGCGARLDLETVKAVEQVIKNDFRQA